MKPNEFATAAKLHAELIAKFPPHKRCDAPFRLTKQGKMLLTMHTTEVLPSTSCLSALAFQLLLFTSFFSPLSSHLFPSTSFLPPLSTNAHRPSSDSGT